MKTTSEAGLVETVVNGMFKGMFVFGIISSAIGALSILLRHL